MKTIYKILPVFFLLNACSQFNTYEQTAAKITQWAPMNQGFSEGAVWVPIDQEKKLIKEYGPKLTKDLNECIAQLQKFSANVNRYTKSALLTSCMHDKGWTLEHEVIVTT